MAAPLMNEVARDYVTDGVPSSGPHEIRKPDLRAWGAWVEQSITTFTNNGGFIYANKAALDADLSKEANTLAWVVGDEVAFDNAIYRKVGASGSGSWVRSADLPYSFISAQNSGSGTPNAIEATSSIPISGSALVLMAITDTNTASPVTVTFNEGDLLTIKSNSGNDIAIGGLQAGMLVMGRVSGSVFRLVSDQVSASIIAQAEDVLSDILSITGSFQPFAKVEAAVGGGVQSIDTGNEDAIAEQIHLFIDGVYQFKSTWSITAGVITPVGGTWPGDGVAINAEVHHVPAFALEDVPPDGSVTRPKIAAGAVGEDQIDPAIMTLINEGGGSNDARILDTDLPFGHAGIRVLLGERYDAHYGLPSGWLVFPSGKWTLIYRKASSHAITDGAQVRAVDSYDQGATLENDRLIYTNASHDARPDAPRLFANGRSGFMVNRQDEGTAHFSPLLIYSDDEFETFSTKTLTTPTGYTFASNGGIIEFPASQGGHDTLGFIAFGFVGAGSYGRISTADNWETYTVATGVANLTHTPATGTAITALSEWSGGRVPGEDKWIFYLRCQDAGGWRDEAACFVTTNLLSWGSARPSNINLGGNPPCCFADPETNSFHFVAFGRGGRGIDGFDHHMLIASADADALWAANGNWDALSPAVDWKIVTPVPNWATGYMAPVKVGDHWIATFVCGEPGNSGGNKSILAMIGDFVPSSTDDSKWQEAFRWNAIFKRVRAGLSATTNPPAEANFVAGVDSAAAGYIGYNAGSVSRTYFGVYNSNGYIGGIVGGGTSTTFQTTSDGRLKIDRVPIEDEVDLDAVWAAVEPLAYTMLSGTTLEATDGRYFGLVAQELHAVFPSAVTVGEGEPGEREFRPWGVDYSKLVPLMIARQKQFERRVTDRLNALERAK